MRTLILKTENFVSFFDFSNSHMQLLLRSSYFVDGQQQNLDILFGAVYQLQTITIFEGLEIYEGDDDDKKYIAQSEKLDIYWKAGLRLYVLISNGWKYYIIAGFAKVYINELPNDQTSILMKKNWYNPTT